MAIVRGCGTRVAGGVYAECTLSPTGKPVEFFLCDPPLPLDPALGVSPIGVTLTEREGVTHILDWVGTNHYHNVADFIEETRRFGLSRRLPRNLDFSRITTQSSVILIHSRAIIQDPTQHNRDRQRMRRLGADSSLHVPWCPKDILDHELAGGVDYPRPTPGIERVPPTVMCASLWWEDLEIGAGDLETAGTRDCTRRMPSFEYNGWQPPATLDGHKHTPGIFAAFPVGSIAVIRNREDEKDHLRAFDVAAKAGVVVNLEDE
jgi:hypothetical protein